MNRPNSISSSSHSSSSSSSTSSSNNLDLNAIISGIIKQSFDWREWMLDVIISQSSMGGGGGGGGGGPVLSTNNNQHKVLASAVQFIKSLSIGAPYRSLLAYSCANK